MGVTYGIYEAGVLEAVVGGDGVEDGEQRVDGDVVVLHFLVQRLWSFFVAM